MKKTINILLVILMAELITACCDENYQTITGIESKAYRLEGNEILEFDQQNPINKKDLVVQLIINFNNQTSLNDYYQKEEEVKVLKASVTPFCDPEPNYTNKIESITVEVVDVDNNNTSVDITDQVVVIGADMTVSEYIALNVEGDNSLILELADTTNIPNRIDYNIEVTLDDGLKISSSTGVIIFN